MNILYFSPSNNIGGAELSLLETIKFMTGNGNQVYVALPHSANLSYVNLLTPYCQQIIYVKPMKWFYIVNSNRSWFKGIFDYLYSTYKSGWHLVPIIKLYLFIKKKNIDLAHTNTSLAIDAAIAAKLAGVLHILHLREITGFSEASTMKLYFQGTTFFKKAMSFLNSSIVCNSKFTYESSKPYFPPAKMSVIYNPIEIAQNFPSQKVKSGSVFGCVANLTSNWKNHQLAIRFIKKIRSLNPGENYTLNFYGNLPPDDNAYFKNLKLLIQEMELNDFIFFKGTLASNAIYNEIDYLFHPTPFEPFGRVIIEAMSNKVLVIGINQGGVKELINDDETGFLISIENFESDVVRISSALKSQPKVQLLIDKALKESNKFRPSIVLNQLLDKYKVDLKSSQ